MEFPDNEATRLTEQIMRIFWPGEELALGTPKYNKVYSHVYQILEKRFSGRPAR